MNCSASRSTTSISPPAFAPTRSSPGSRQARIKAVPTGIAHGTITAVADGQPAEITTPSRRRLDRRPPRHGRIFRRLAGRRRAPRFHHQRALRRPRDAARFSIISAASTTSAPAASASSAIRSSASPRITLRILRFFRFHARFGAGRARPGRARRLHGARQRPHGPVARAHRRRDDQDRSPLPDPVATVALMIERGIFAPVLPEISRPHRASPRSSPTKPPPASPPTRSAASPRCCRAIPPSPTRSPPASRFSKRRASASPPPPIPTSPPIRAPSPTGPAPKPRSIACCSPASRDAAAPSPAGRARACRSRADD